MKEITRKLVPAVIGAILGTLIVGMLLSLFFFLTSQDPEFNGFGEGKTTSIEADRGSQSPGVDP